MKLTILIIFAFYLGFLSYTTTWEGREGREGSVPISIISKESNTRLGKSNLGFTGKDWTLFVLANTPIVVAIFAFIEEIWPISKRKKPLKQRSYL